MRQTLRLPLPSTTLNRILSRPSTSAASTAATLRKSLAPAAANVASRSFGTNNMSLLRSNLFNSPFEDFDVLPSAFRDLVNPWSGGLVTRPQEFFRSERMWSGPRIDLHEEDTKFVLTAELPGVKKEDVKINVDADRRRVTLEGHMKSEYQTPSPAETQATTNGGDKAESAGKAQDKGASKEVTTKQQGETRVGHPLVSERVFGSFTRTFTLPPTANLADDKALKARFDNGLLKLEIPKKQEEHSKTRQIAIESA